MELNIYAPDFTYLGVIDGFSSFRRRHQVFDAGEVELHVEMNAYTRGLMLTEHFIHQEGYDEIGIIEGVKISDVEGKGEMIASTGRLGNAILGRAILDKTYNFDETPVEVAMRQLVGDLMPRVYPNIELGELQGFTETISAQITYRNLLDVLLAMAKASGVLFKLRADIPGKMLFFDTYKGVDRTIGQTDVPRVVFSSVDNTLANPTYEENVKNWKNYAIVGGEGEDDARVKVEINRVPAGGFRREMFVDAKSVKRGTLSLSKYRALLTQYGDEKLDEVDIVQNLEAAAELENTYQYRTEWEDGDVVTVHQEDWDIILDERITEVEEVYDESTGEAGTVTPTFGSPLPEKFNLGG